MRMKKDEVLYIHRIDSPLGEIKLFSNDKALVGVYLKKEKVGKFHERLKHAVPKKTRVLLQAEKELNRYFKGQLKQFTVPFEFTGTPFQLAVWKGLCKIKSGSICSYAEHASKVSDPKAVRAVSSAIGSNPLSIIVPCHRVVSKTGKLTGYAGGLQAKEWLLNHEGHKVHQQRVSV